MSGVLGNVSTSMSAYLFTHPDVNDFITGLAHDSADDRKKSIDGYMADNPQVNDEMNAIRQPLKDFRTRCGMSVPAPLPPGEGG
ncbi:heme-binding protein [Mycolicibacterium palauense]|uniref:heme-binding protein n=1 Tax=Mycolicibacterium palauense TaxID=2034511 RepID=UPI000BFEB7B3|nr:heme-binding protein [Mycolicibacterium palauense]